MGNCTVINCEQYLSDLNQLVTPDPDITGVGVLLAFAISGWLTLVLCLAYYTIDPEVSSQHHEDHNIPSVNPVDGMYLKKLGASLAWIGHISEKKWSEPLRTAVLAFSDLQSVTGIAILVSGYSQLVSCQPMTVYNWQITVDLAWFSSITHLTTLTCLRNYFQQRPALRIWRLSCMTINATILAIALGSTGWEFVSPEMPALCLYRPIDVVSADPGPYRTPPVYNSFYIAITATFLVTSYLTRVIQLYPKAQASFRNLFRNCPSTIYNRWLNNVKDRALHSSGRSVRLCIVVAYRILLSQYYVTKAAVDLYTSMLWEITWLTVALVWGTMRVINHRSVVYYYRSGFLLTLNSGDSTWAFGQVIAVILLLLPFITFSEAVYESFSPPNTLPSSTLRPNTHTSLVNPNFVYMSIQNSPQSSKSPYQYRWLRKTVLLMYCASLTFAGDLLYLFPYLGFIVNLNIKNQFSYQTTSEVFSFYAEWFFLTTIIVWLFGFISMSVPDEEAALHLNWMGRRFGNLPQSQRTWKNSLAWNCIVAIALIGLIAFDVFVHYLSGFYL